MPRKLCVPPLGQNRLTLCPRGKCKAGRLVGLVDCYAVIALADNATFLLAVNRIAIAVAQLVEQLPANLEVVGLTPT